MIKFLTCRKDHDKFIYKSAKIEVSDNLDEIDKILGNFYLGFDTEGNGGRYHISEVLLIQMGNKDSQVVIDFTDPHGDGVWRTKVTERINSKITDKHLFIGHNLKHDQNVCTRHGIRLPDFFDTMISSQRFWMGSGMLNNLKDVYERELNKFFPEDKAIRNDFMYMNAKSRFLIKHIMYGAADIGDIIEIAQKLKKKLEERGQHWFVREVEFPLIKVLSESELEGMNVNNNKWSKMLQDKQQQRFTCEKEMDKMIIELGKGRQQFVGGKFNLRRTKAQVQQTNMFSDELTVEENKNKHNINYNSRDEIFDIIRNLDLPIPILKEKNEVKDSLKEEAIMTYLMMYPSTPLRSFFEKLLEYKGLQKFISSYGDKFLYSIVRKDKKYIKGYVNPITKRVHTQYKQCFLPTGRLSSGESKKMKVDKKDKIKEDSMGVFNIQNLPAEKEIREAFELSQEDILDGYYFTTIDYSGIELVLMAALANDDHLYELGALKDDIHSPVATKCWRAVFQYRKSKAIAELKATKPIAKDYTDDQAWEYIKTNFKSELDKHMTIQDTKSVKYILTEDIYIDKKTNKQLRTDFKSMIFGTFYGLAKKKGSETLNIPQDDAQVVIDIIRREFPKTIKMLEAATWQAFRHGYVIFNNRSNNRRLFSPVLELLSKIDEKKYSDEAIIAYIKENLSFTQQVDIIGEALNCRIQGTGADIIKEAMVEVYKHPQYKTAKAKILCSVHDELGVKHIGKEFGAMIKKIMIDVANRYLEPYSPTIRMKAESNWDEKDETKLVKYSWTK